MCQEQACKLPSRPCCRPPLRAWRGSCPQTRGAGRGCSLGRPRRGRAGQGLPAGAKGQARGRRRGWGRRRDEGRAAGEGSQAVARGAGEGVALAGVTEPPSSSGRMLGPDQAPEPGEEAARNPGQGCSGRTEQALGKASPGAGGQRPGFWLRHLGGQRNRLQSHEPWRRSRGGPGAGQWQHWTLAFPSRGHVGPQEDTTWQAGDRSGIPVPPAGSLGSSR